MRIFKRIMQALGTMKSLYYNEPQSEFGHCGKGVLIEWPTKIVCPRNLFIDDDVAIRGFFTFTSHHCRLHIKSHCDISQRFTVTTINHTVKPPLDKWQVECNHTTFGDTDSDVTIEEDVWIGINVTVLPGVTIGRGSIIGACSVVTKDIPPYSVAVGNPCRVIRHKFKKTRRNYQRVNALPPTTLIA